jgi:polar amino acid transport system substrate-binding protein
VTNLTPSFGWPRLFLAFFALAWLAIGVAAQAADKAPPNELPIGATEWPPFEYSDANGKPVGSDTEIIEQVIQRMGYTPNMQLQPWKRVEVYATQGQFAGIYSVVKTPEREQHFYYSDPISASSTVFFKRKSDAIEWKNFDDLKTKHIAVGGGYAYPAVFMDAVKRKAFASVKETFDAQADLSNLKQLKAGLVDLVVCEVNVCNFLIKSHAKALAGLDYSPTVIGTTIPMYVAFSKKWPNAQNLTQQFNQALANFIAEGSRAKIFKAYGIRWDGK